MDAKGALATLLLGLLVGLAAAEGEDVPCRADDPDPQCAVRAGNLLQVRALREQVRMDSQTDDREEDEGSQASAAGFGDAGMTARPATDAEKGVFLQEHNVFRCMHGVPPLRWNADVAADAESWIADKKTMIHSNSYAIPPPAGPAGENLYYTSWWRPTAKKVVEKWYYEANYCKTGSATNFKDGCAEAKTGKATGHFTAMIWKGATELGCAWSDSSRPYLAICRYKAGDSLSNDTPNMNKASGNYVKHVLVKTKTANECFSSVGPGSGSPAPAPATPPSSGPAPAPTPANASMARFVRIWPQTWHGSISTRAAVLVGDNLRVVNPPEATRRYSSVQAFQSKYSYSDDGYPGSYRGRSMINQGAGHGWTARHQRLGEWLQIDLGTDMDVRGVVIQGKPKRGCPHGRAHFVQSIKVQTATEAQPAALHWCDSGKVWHTTASENKGTVRIAFGSAGQVTTTPAPPAPPPAGGHCDEAMSGRAADYRGCQTMTRSGKACQRWDQQSPHRHTRTPSRYPNAGLSANFCRNPDNEPTIWCYTTNPSKRWEFCNALPVPPPAPAATPMAPTPSPSTPAPTVVLPGPPGLPGARGPLGFPGAVGPPGPPGPPR